jgi:hypothetical protein
MKTLQLLGAAACALFLAGAARAADDVKTITGEAMCAKCELHQQATCQTVIQVQEAGKTVSYYVAPNAVGKAFHSNVCEAPAPVTATGTVTHDNGKLVLTASSIELKK